MDVADVRPYLSGGAVRGGALEEGFSSAVVPHLVLEVHVTLELDESLDSVRLAPVRSIQQRRPTVLQHNRLATKPRLALSHVILLISLFKKVSLEMRL